MNTRKTLLIGLDGVQFHCLHALALPNLSALTLREAYTGGERGTRTEQATDSGPGWSTILTGVWVDQHAVGSNDDGESAWPSLFHQLHSDYPVASLVSIAAWGPINSQFFPGDTATLHHVVNNLSDDACVTAALAHLDAADFLFLQLDAPDAAGHRVGFGEDYFNAIQMADRQVGQLMEKVAQRQAQGENWLVIVTTDHGRAGVDGFDHGGQSAQERAAFIATNRPELLPASAPLPLTAIASLVLSHHSGA